jgi:hypothetical protein
MKCWICGKNANSKEHLIKASDLKLLFGHITAESPLYIHSDKKRNKLINGVKSDKLKYSASICRHCNETRTQPHDDAWKKLSEYLKTRKPVIQAGDTIRLNRPFPEGGVSKSMLNVHLFFLKLFGCLIVENAIPLDINQFSQSILHGVAHPNVWLAFHTDFNYSSLKRVGYSDLKSAGYLNSQSSYCITYTTWFYIIDRFAVNIMYAEPTENRRGLIHAWHPSTVGKRVRIC